ncbi:uncharacterized protein LOC126815065, partial [Patella vulgata]|uniref:uncharacterized protein LOC126815065 n=1 Tax=Patella vulgata TaxID=6465 RepID=UPI00217F9F8F
RLNCVGKLVDAGADTNQLNEEKDTPISIAANVKHVNGDKVTPVVVAARKGLYDVVKYMLKHGIDLHYENNLV